MDVTDDYCLWSSVIHYIIIITIIITCYVCYKHNTPFSVVAGLTIQVDVH